MRTLEADREVAVGVFEPLDLEFGRLMERLAGAPCPVVRLAASLVSHRRSQGDVCLDLAEVAGESWEMGPGEILTAPAFDVWCAALRNASVVGAPGEVQPLLLDTRGRLYLRRYWWYEQTVAGALETLAQEGPGNCRPDPERLRQLLDALFPPTGDAVDWQRVAAFAAARRRLCLVSGGPGTGKTTTVVRILALLAELASPRELRIAVTAPTGKAAARLQESLRQQRAALEARFPAAAGLPVEVQTLHRLLGPRPGTPYFRHDSQHPLPVDVLVVDEASMVDLALMAKLLLAVPPGARVILLGDKDQLASVEAGNVLGDLSSDPELNQFSAGFLSDHAAAGGTPLPARRGRGFPLADTVIQLRRSHRFPEGSGIQQVSAAVNRGDADAALQALTRPWVDSAGGIVGRPLPVRGRLREALRPVVLDAFGSVIRCPDASLALAAMNRFRLLAAVREGPYGVVTLNAMVIDLLRDAGCLDGAGDWFRGRQILVTSNDYSVSLFNGDLGIVWPDEQGRPMAWFPGPDGTVRRVSPGRLPAHETAFALTVHKSQGSEFDSVLLILPDRTSRVLTRELVYTGLTRARQRTEVWSVEGVLREAIGRRTERTSGLRDRLWSGGGSTEERR